MVRLRACFVASAVICAACVSLRAGAADKDTVGPTLFRYKGQAYTAADLTLVSYSEYQKQLSRAKAIYDPSKHRLPLGGYGPVWDGLKTDHPPDFEGAYKKGMDGLIAIFVRYQVFLELKRKYGGERMRRYYDAASVGTYITTLAEQRETNANACVEGLEANGGMPAFRKSLMEKANIHLDDKTFQDIFDSLAAERPYYELYAGCFPIMRDGRIAPWFEYETEACLIRYYIQAEIEGAKDKYVRLLDEEWGRSTAIIVRNVTENGLSEAARAVGKMANDKGQVALAGLASENKTLNALGSPTRYEVLSGCYPRYAAVLGIPVETIAEQRMIDIGPSKSNAGCRDYLYIPQTASKHEFKDYPTTPGGLLYNMAHAMIVRPLFEEVIRSLEVSDGYALPPLEEQVNRAIGVPFERNWGGRKLPKVILVDD